MISSLIDKNPLVSLDEIENIIASGRFFHRVDEIDPQNSHRFVNPQLYDSFNYLLKEICDKRASGDSFITFSMLSRDDPYSHLLSYFNEIFKICSKRN